MKKIFVTCCLMISVFVLAWHDGDVMANDDVFDVLEVNKSTGPPSCVAGEPPNNTNCTISGCHDDGTVNTGSATISLDLGGAESGYELGKTYKITVSISKTGMKRAGFQAIALIDNNITTSPGKITLTEPGRTQIIDKNHTHNGSCATAEKVWIEHQFNGISVGASGTNTWTYDWQAPANDVGSITFYLASLESNNNLMETGDQAYTTKKTIQPGPTAIEEEYQPVAIKLYPNPVTDVLVIESAGSGILNAELYDMAGKAVQVWPVHVFAGNHKISLPLHDIETGAYLMKVSTAKGVTVEKVLVK